MCEVAQHRFHALQDQTHGLRKARNLRQATPLWLLSTSYGISILIYIYLYVMAGVINQSRTEGANTMQMRYVHVHVMNNY